MVERKANKRANMLAVVLGGGHGSRLMPLTRDRAKPAVPIAGKYRLVDIPISNCLNSHIRRIFVLTQFNSVSLHEHIQGTYRFDEFHYGFVRILAAQQTAHGEAWFNGTADAVRQSLRYFDNEEPDYILVLSGDQLYRMDFSAVLRCHQEAGAEVTICTKPVQRSEAADLGIMQVDETNRITRFVEKPGPDGLGPLGAVVDGQERFLASMGIYIFNTDVLRRLLEGEQPDFGRHIIPDAIGRFRVFSFAHKGYWRDIGTVRSFWEANLELTEVVPQFTFYDTEAPIFTHRRFLPPSKINCCDLSRCLLSDGCIISGHRILHSIVGVRALVGERSVIEHSVIMGADLYEPGPPPNGIPPIGIGRDCFISRAIIDKNARIGDGSYLSPEGQPDGARTDWYSIRDGVLVIPKNAVIPPNTKL